MSRLVEIGVLVEGTKSSPWLVEVKGACRLKVNQPIDIWFATRNDAVSSDEIRPGFGIRCLNAFDARFVFVVNMRNLSGGTRRRNRRRIGHSDGTHRFRPRSPQCDSMRACRRTPGLAVQAHKCSRDGQPKTTKFHKNAIRVRCRVPPGKLPYFVRRVLTPALNGTTPRSCRFA